MVIDGLAPCPLPLLPDPNRRELTATVGGLDQDRTPLSLRIIEEQAWTIYLDSEEVVTVMTIGDYPDLLALGYSLNQHLLSGLDQVARLEIDRELRVVVLRSRNPDENRRLGRRIRTSGCAEGTLYEKVMEQLEGKTLASGVPLDTRTMVAMLGTINTTPSLYLEAGAIHGCALCRGDELLAYIEDVGRHNAVDKIAGLMHVAGISGEDCWFYTTGRLTTEMVVKTVQMGIPVLVSRSGLTAAGVVLAERSGLTMIARARGKRFQLLTHPNRIRFAP